MNFTAAQFADEIGVQKSGISHIISGRNNPSLDFIQKILLRFPDVNMEWLIQGKGPMVKGEQTKLSRPDNTLFAASESDSPALDLFSQEISNSGSVKELLNPEQKRPEMEIESSKAVPQVREADQKEKDPVAPVHDTMGSSRKLEKIVFFYSDKTFLEYYPED